MGKLRLVCGRTITKMVKTVLLRSEHSCCSLTFGVNGSAGVSCQHIWWIIRLSGGHTADAKRRPGLRGADVWEEALQWAQVQHLHRSHNLSWRMSECGCCYSAKSLLLKTISVFKFLILRILAVGMWHLWRLQTREWHFSIHLLQNEHECD